MYILKRDAMVNFLKTVCIYIFNFKSKIHEQIKYLLVRFDILYQTLLELRMTIKSLNTEKSSLL